MSVLALSLMCDGYDHGYPVSTEAMYGGTRGTVEITEDAAINGTHGLNVQGADENAGLRNVWDFATQFFVTQLRFRANSLPTDDCYLAYVGQVSGTKRYLGMGFHQATNSLRMFGVDTSGVTWGSDGPEIEPGGVYLLDWYQNGLAVEWQIDEVAQASESFSSLLTGGVPGRLFLGPYHDLTTSLNFDFDDVVVTRVEDTRRPIYPIGPGKVSLISAAGEGTHSGDSDFTDSDGISPPVDPDGKLSTHDEADTDYVVQTTGDATAYLEFTPSTLVDVDDPVNAIMGWLRQMRHSGSGGSCRTQLRITLDGVETAVIGTGGETATPTWRRSSIAAGSVDLTLEMLETMGIRLGFDSLADAVPTRTYDLFLQVHTSLTDEPPPPDPEPEDEPPRQLADDIYYDQLGYVLEEVS